MMQAGWVGELIGFGLGFGGDGLCNGVVNLGLVCSYDGVGNVE